jgi:hypothetical protein
MNKIKKIVLSAGLLMVLAVAVFNVTGCKKDKDDEEEEDDTEIKGNPGNPRFNLQFTGGTINDVDLYVKTPNGSIISYTNPAAQNGKLDVDCLCGDCPNGPNENIYWTAGTAPTGTYQVWAQYFGACATNSGSSNYTIRVMKNSSVLNTYTGTVSTNSPKSSVYSFTFNP